MTLKFLFRHREPRRILTALNVLGISGILCPVYGAPCQNIPPGYVVAVTPHQNVGGIEPTNLVVLDTRVRRYKSRKATPRASSPKLKGGELWLASIAKILVSHF